MRFRHLDKLPFSVDDDNFIGGVLVGEAVGYDLTQPIVGLHFRGTSWENAGWLVRLSLNLAYDRQHEDEPICSAGMNYHHRLRPLPPNGSGTWQFEWDARHVTVTGPLGSSVQIALPLEGGFGVGRLIAGTPWPMWPLEQRRYLVGGSRFDARSYGVQADLGPLTGISGSWLECPLEER